MKLGDCTRSFIAAAALLTPALSWAETHSEAYNGATCIPYPPYNVTDALPYGHLLYAQRQSAFCHFTVPNGWSVNDLSYVLFEGSVSSGTMRVRLCVYSGTTVSCGADRTLTGGSTINWVSPPSPTPAYATGAYLAINFPNGSLSTFRQFHVAFFR